MRLQNPKHGTVSLGFVFFFLNFDSFFSFFFFFFCFGGVALFTLWNTCKRTLGVQTPSATLTTPLSVLHEYYSYSRKREKKKKKTKKNSLFIFLFFFVFSTTNSKIERGEFGLITFIPFGI